jgi:hypothetical protein
MHHYADLIPGDRITLQIRDGQHATFTVRRIVPFHDGSYDATLSDAAATRTYRISPEQAAHGVQLHLTPAA